MENVKEKTLNKTAEAFKALADRTRLKIVLNLIEGEKCVHEIAETTEQNISNVSHHLRKLRDKRLIDYRKEGRHKIYYIVDEHVLKITKEGINHGKE
ncbi:MAG: ArsR/SmtB family transcription factor [Candidatus Hadarchaeia archaeon]